MIANPILLLLLLGACGLAIPAAADPAPTVTIATRTFLVGEAPSENNEPQDFLPLTSVDWIQDVIEADPLLPRGVVHIKKLPSRPAWLFGREGMLSHYGDLDRVPEEIRVPGLVAEVSPTDPLPISMVMYHPPGDASDFLVTCDTGWDREFDPLLCVLLATYPPDPEITLMVRLYFPGPLAEVGSTFPAVAARLREIATCLDVTGEALADPAARLAEIRTAHPTLEGCGPVTTS